MIERNEGDEKNLPLSSQTAATLLLSSQMAATIFLLTAQMAATSDSGAHCFNTSSVSLTS
jgi:hypothetical protein